jgi:MOSC domain-containing protein YiiM
MSHPTKLFMGSIRPLPPEGQPTGIFKEEVQGSVWLGREGLVGDAQADRRVHGGPDKALHQYPVSHYARLAIAFPAAVGQLMPGSMGENLSVPGWDETNVCIGDSFRLGDALIQISQPRSPCWKIDRRFGVEGMKALIQEQGIIGWYYRVIEEGEVEPGCRFEHVERPVGTITVARLLALWREPDLDRATLMELSSLPGLATNWLGKIGDRLAKLG